MVCLAVQIRREQQELAQRLGADKLAVLQKRAQARQALPALASPAHATPVESTSGPASSATLGSGQPGGSQGGAGNPGRAPRPQWQRAGSGGEVAPPDVHQLLAATAAAGECEQYIQLLLP